MMPLVLGAMPGWGVALLVVGFLFVSVFMILVVLIQRPQGGGLAGAFGGGGGAGQTAFGARTGDALTIATITIFIVYLFCAVLLNYTLEPPSAQFAPATVQGSTTGGTTPASSPESQTVIPVPAPDDGSVGPVAPAPEPAPEGEAVTGGETPQEEPETPAQEPPAQQEEPPVAPPGGG